MIASPWTLLALALPVTALMMLALWILGVQRVNFSFVDIGWAANFALLAVLYATFAPGYVRRRWLFAAMFSVHGLRLAWHLAGRIIGQPEEGRYAALRRQWGGGRLNLKFLAFFEFQALLDVVLSVPLLIACFDVRSGFRALEWIGVVVFVIGFAGESMADAQLAAFKRDPANRGGVCDFGLWRYSRHPNYFFEWLIWVSYALYALASPFGWIALAMPALMLHFLVNVTGVKATEEQAVRSKGALYRRYQARTSVFIPWFPKRVVQ